MFPAAYDAPRPPGASLFLAERILRFFVMCDIEYIAALTREGDAKTRGSGMDTEKKTQVAFSLSGSAGQCLEFHPTFSWALQVLKPKQSMELFCFVSTGKYLLWQNVAKRFGYVASGIAELAKRELDKTGFPFAAEFAAAQTAFFQLNAGFITLHSFENAPFYPVLFERERHETSDLRHWVFEQGADGLKRHGHLNSRYHPLWMMAETVTECLSPDLSLQVKSVADYCSYVSYSGVGPEAKEAEGVIADCLADLFCPQLGDCFKEMPH